MFENLSDRLGGVFDRLTKQGALSEEDVTAAMREAGTGLKSAWRLRFPGSTAPGSRRRPSPAAALRLRGLLLAL